ncbi:hypothetical protein GCM10027342_18290 [Photobacterium alginatilyticum]
MVSPFFLIVGIYKNDRYMQKLKMVIGITHRATVLLQVKPLFDKIDKEDSSGALINQPKSNQLHIVYSKLLIHSPIVKFLFPQSNNINEERSHYVVC